MPTDSDQHSRRSPDRIPELMALVQAQWQQNPDLRLMQLLVCLVNPREPCPEVFYAEDDVLLGLLSELPYPSE